MKKIVLYGELAKRFGKTHFFAVKNVSEAVRALKVNFKGFEDFMCGAHKYGVGFKVFVGNCSLSEIDEIKDPISDRETIRLVPAILGAGGPLKIFIGAVLIGAGVVLAPFSAGTSTGLIAAGSGLVIGGIATLLTKIPNADLSGNSNPDKKTSYVFNGPVNSTIQGGAVPVGYGRLIIGSIIISAGIETHDEA